MHTPRRRDALRPPIVICLTLAFAAPASAQGVQVWRPAPGGVVIAAPIPVRTVVDQVAVTPPAARVDRRVRAALRRQLAERRRLNLRRFVAYRDAGEFPRNHVRAGMLNVFIDDEGHICAAANLMNHDGMMSVVRHYARVDNYLRLADVRDGPLYRWMLASGFTQDEVAAIQEPYDFIEPEMPDEPIHEEVEKRRLQARFTEVVRLVRRQRARSLDEAVDTLIAYRLGHGVAVSAPISAAGDPGRPATGAGPAPVRPAPAAPTVLPPPRVVDFSARPNG